VKSIIRDVLSVFLIGFFLGAMISLVHFHLSINNGVALAIYIAAMCGSLALYMLAHR